ncbi:hypothetical protein [Paenibacillus methanolicus]|uniref:Uncharacterized protein n=1 Tax=Paenibacillus methanolicus TaxID=582686 RepID=A0A5S5C8U5_9BACL|nr:hypothetical protein [Paenibacillus methanolicus]TYP75599.1 hypothetical protein BCM02_104279 [Paenibacillus methanolicus]
MTNSKRNEEQIRAQKREVEAGGGAERRDHPEQYPTEKPSLFDMWESERTVDPIPVEELNIAVRDERRKSHTKDESSSPDKYHSGFKH